MATDILTSVSDDTAPDAAEAAEAAEQAEAATAEAAGELVEALRLAHLLRTQPDRLRGAEHQAARYAERSLRALRADRELDGLARAHGLRWSRDIDDDADMAPIYPPADGRMRADLSDPHN